MIGKDVRSEQFSIAFVLRSKHDHVTDFIRISQQWQQAC